MWSYLRFLLCCSLSKLLKEFSGYLTGCFLQSFIQPVFIGSLTVSCHFTSTGIAEVKQTVWWQERPAWHD